MTVNGTTCPCFDVLQRALSSQEQMLAILYTSYGVIRETLSHTSMLYLCREATRPHVRGAWEHPRRLSKEELADLSEREGS